MTPEYCIVNECLVLLREVDMPPIKKLRIEIQLMQMKRMLLDENFPVESCKDPLRGVLSDIRKISKGEHDTDTVSSLMERMGRIMNLPRCEGGVRQRRAVDGPQKQISTGWGLLLWRQWLK